MSLFKTGIVSSYKSVKKSDGSFKNQVRFEDGDSVYGINAEIAAVGAEGTIEVELFQPEPGKVLLMAKGSRSDGSAPTLAEAQANAEPQEVVDARRADYLARAAAAKAAKEAAEQAATGANGALGN